MTVNDLLGIGMGVLGMSLDDWERLRPDEFEACWRAHADCEDEAERAAWERMRLLATIVVQPHCKSKLTAKKLLPLPWDNKTQVHNEAPKMSKEEHLARMETARRKMGG